MTHYLPTLALACAVMSAQAAPCLPKQLGGTGTAALVASPPAGQFAAWRCGSQTVVVACVTRECGLVGAKRAVAAWLSAPDASKLTFGKDPHRDAALLAVWKPYAKQIDALK